ASNLAEGQAKGKCWVFPAGPATSIDVDVRDMPDGEYVWQVLSLGLSGKAVEDSPSRGFSLSRHNATSITPLPDLSAQYRVVSSENIFMYPVSPRGSGGDGSHFSLLVTGYLCLEAP